MTLQIDSVSVVVPAYNEQSCIEATIDRLSGYLERKFSRYEIIVVDDGSTDATAEKVRHRTATNRHLLLRSSPANRGKGFAVREGVMTANFAAVLFTDADLSTPVEEIGLAIAELNQGFPVVIASRRHPNSIIARRQNWPRDAIGRCFNVVVRALFSLPFRDTQCGFKCFTRAAAREIFMRASIDTFSFDVEILMIAMSLGLGIKEIPVVWTNAPNSKVRPLSNAATIVRELFMLYRRQPNRSAICKRSRR